ncbi:MAG: M12 family metallopeptidase [Nitrospira sp.]|nr:M12 family metallopeptidase [Nitrospira sp.]
MTKRTRNRLNILHLLLLAVLFVSGCSDGGQDQAAFVPNQPSPGPTEPGPDPTPPGQSPLPPDNENGTPATFTIQGPNGELSTLTGRKVGQEFVYQGDMRFRYPEKSGQYEPFGIGIRRFKRWDNGVIPYYLQTDHPYRAAILRAIDTLNRNTVLWYVPATDPSSDHISIQYGEGCSSGVGTPWFGDGYQVSLGAGCNVPGIIMHELLHAAGLFHEQSREDRDNYLTIYWDNIKKDDRHNWSKDPWWSKSVGPYNPESVMHYDCMASSLAVYPEEKTMDSKIQVPFGQRVGLSAGDVAAINAMYYNVSADRGKPAMAPEPLPTLVYDPRCTYDNRTVTVLSNGRGRLTTVVRGNSTTYHIDEPYVQGTSIEYPEISFDPGDTMYIQAGGCVQTGGRGRTWKRYLDPSGNNSDHLYWGTILISGLVGDVPGAHNPPIRDHIGALLTIPAGPRLTLSLGYEDDNYDDNGYWGHDDGTENQCKNVGNAYVSITKTKT